MIKLKHTALLCSALVILSTSPGFSADPAKKTVNMSDAVASEIRTDRQIFFIDIADADKKFFNELRSKTLTLSAEDKLVNDHWKTREKKINQFRAAMKIKRDQLATLEKAQKTINKK